MRRVALYLLHLLYGMVETFLQGCGSIKNRHHKHLMDTNLPAARHGVTQRYPHETLHVPDHGRYKLHNEISDCIVCDKCARVCPVDCIDIVPIRSEKEIGKTTDGKSKRMYAARFDIDMAKCCFCGLCTTVCPTECLTMTNEYDFSTEEINTHRVGFATMSEEEVVEKQRAWATFTAKKKS